MDKTRVLIADDEAGILELITAMLDPHDFQVTTALNARDALTAVLRANAAGTPYQLVIADIRMPGMSGLVMLQNLNAMEPGLPVLAITGYATEDLPSQLKQFGCLLCIHKPFNKPQLLDGIAKTLATP